MKIYRTSFNINRTVNFRVRFIFFIALLIIFILSLSVNINAATSFPTSGNDSEKQKWILENQDKVDFRDPEQKATVEKYLISLKTISTNSDRKFLEGLLKYQTLNRIQIDFSKGQGISLKKEDNNLFLVSSDGQKWNIDGFNSMNIQGKKLEKIQSRDDGTIDLFFGSDSIHLKDNTLKTDTIGRLILNDGTILDLKNGFGNLDIDGNSIGCSSVKCSFSIGLMGFELNKNGIFNNLGNNRFSVLDGKVKIGENLLSGNFEITTDSQRKNLGNKVTIGKINDEAKNINSFIQTDSKDYGKVEIRSSSGDKIIACFDCSDFIKHIEKYDGYVDLKKQFVACLDEFGSCRNNFKAEIKGKVGVKFEDDLEHFGNDRNLLLALDSSPNEVKLSLVGCENCAEGEVALLDLNGQPFRIKNEIEDGKQNFDVVQLNPAFPITKDYIRNINIIHKTGEIENVYSIRSDSFVAMKKVTQEDRKNHIKYLSLVNKRETEATKICLNFDSDYCNNVILKFVDEISNGRDGNIVLAGELPTIGGQPYSFGDGNYIAIRNPEIIKCIDGGRCNLNDFVELGKANRDVIAFEKEKKLNDLTIAILESTRLEKPEDVVILAFGGVGAFAKTAASVRGVYTAKTAGEALLAAGKTGIYGADVMLFQFAGVNPGIVSRFDEALAVLPRSFDEVEKFVVPVTQGRQAYLDSLSNNLAEKMGFAPNEIQAVGLNKKFLTGGQENELLDVVAFVHKNPTTGEVTPLTIGVSHFSKEQAEKHIQALNQLDEKLPGHNYGFRGVVTHNTKNVNKEEVDGYMVFVGDLPPETQAKVVESYNSCCHINGISNELNGFAEEATTTASLRTSPRVISSEAKKSSFKSLPEIETKFQGFFHPEKRDFGLSGNPKSLGIYDKVTGENVGDIRYTLQDDILEINQIGIHPEKRGGGYSSAALSKVLDENPDVTRIVGRLEESNKRLLMEKLAELLGEKGKIRVSSDSVDLQFNRCCAEKFRSLPTEERDSLLKSASETTYFYHSASRKGFNKICGINYVPEEPYYTKILIQICK